MARGSVPSSSNLDDESPLCGATVSVRRGANVRPDSMALAKLTSAHFRLLGWSEARDLDHSRRVGKIYGAGLECSGRVSPGAFHLEEEEN